MTSRYTITQQVLATLPATLRATREGAGITVRDAAREIGIATSTLTRLESAHARDTHRAYLTTLIKALAFIDAHRPDE